MNPPTISQAKPEQSDRVIEKRKFIVLATVPIDPFRPHKHLAEALKAKGFGLEVVDHDDDGNPLPGTIAIRAYDRDALLAYKKCLAFPEIKALFLASAGTPGDYVKRDLEEAIGNTEWPDTLQRQVWSLYYTRVAEYHNKFSTGEDAQEQIRAAKNKAHEWLTISRTIPDDMSDGRRGREVIETLPPLRKETVHDLVFGAIEEKVEPLVVTAVH